MSTNLIKPGQVMLHDAGPVLDKDLEHPGHPAIQNPNGVCDFCGEQLEFGCNCPSEIADEY